MIYWQPGICCTPDRIVIQKISEGPVLFEYSNISFRKTCFQSKCGFCTPYQLGTVLEASTVLLFENAVVIKSRVWISLSSLLDQIALFVNTSKDWSITVEDHLWVNMNVLVFFFLLLWVEFGNYYFGGFLHFSLIFILGYGWNGAALYQLLYGTNRQVRYVLCLRDHSQRRWAFYTRG